MKKLREVFKKQRRHMKKQKQKHIKKQKTFKINIAPILPSTCARQTLHYAMCQKRYPINM